MKNDTRYQLDELMLTHERSLTRTHEDEGALERSHEAFLALRDKVIRPALDAFATVLGDHGHRVRIYGHDIAVDAGGHSRNPELFMHVTPKGAAEGAGFVICFSFDLLTHKMLGRVTPASQSDCGHARPFDLHPLEGVTAELVEQELLEMLRYGFESTRHAARERHDATVPA